MITMFNRKELIITRSLEEQARVREVLAAEGIDYTVKVNGGHARGIASQRSYTGSFGENQEVRYEYRIFVKKNDYERAAYLVSRK